MRRFVFVSIVSAVLAVAACGGKSKSNTTPTPTPTGDGTGGDGYGGGGGDGYGGGGYGGDMYGGMGGGNGTFDCVSGVPECDGFFQKTVACAQGSQTIDPDMKTTIIDQLQEACIGLKQAKDAGGHDEDIAEAAQGCAQAAAEQGPAIAEQLGCTW